MAGMSRVHEFTVELDAPLDQVFAWHERPGALTRLAPPWQPIRVLSEARSLRDGRAVLALPAGFRWVARHHGYEPPHRFVDELTSLPLRWRHEHEFTALSATSTRLTDRVHTPVPDALMRGMFAYRHRQLVDDLAAHRWAGELLDGPLTVAVTGSSGLVGTALTAFLSTGGHRVVPLVRRAARRPGERTWHPHRPDPDLLDDVDAVVHLAGTSIAGRFTARHKAGLRDSRIEPTRKLAEVAARATSGPRVFVTASAIGYYGPDRGDEVLTETSERGAGFLADLVSDWEAATAPATEAGLRTVRVRTGIVQTPAGGQLALQYPMFAAGAGGRLGSGAQWMSWISLDDLLDVYLRALADDRLSGPVNGVGPRPVRNAEYTATLGRVLHRPAVVPVPGFGPRLLLGAEGASELAQASQRVQPAALRAVDHGYRHAELAGALRHLLGRADRPSQGV